MARQAHYAVRVALADGTRTVHVSEGRLAIVPDVPARQAATVTVRGMDASGKQGPAVRLRVRGRRR